MRNNGSGNRINPWCGEHEFKANGASIKLRCRMEQFATLCASLECESLVDVYKKWDALDPEVLKKSFEVLAESPDEARNFWPCINGMDGITALVRSFYVVTSGKTPEQLEEERQNRKKLRDWLMEKEGVLINQVVEQLILTGEIPE